LDTKELAQQVSTETGIPADIIHGQWAFESGGFSNWGSTHANNFGGLKKFQDQPDWFTGDAKSPEGDDYQVFDSPQAYASYYSKYLTKYYPEALTAKNPEDFARALRNGGYYGGDPNDSEDTKIAKYAAGIKSGMGQGQWDLAGVTTSGDAYGIQPGGVPTEEPIPQSFSSYMRDKWGQGFYDNGLVGLGRELWSGLNTTKDINYKPSQDDFEKVKVALPDDPVAQRWVLLNAQNPEQLQKMIQMKQEDAQRLQRIEQYKGNWITNIAGFGSMVAGGIAGDPSVLLPVIGQEAIGLKLLGNIGTKTAAMLSASKILRYAEIGAQQAALNVASRYGAEKYAGFSQDYTSAGLIGFAAGAGLSALGSLVRRVPRFSSTANVIGALDNAESHSIAMGMDLRPPSELPKLRDIFQGAHDPAFIAKQGSSVLSKLAEDGKVITVSKADLAPYAVNYGIDLKTTKAFHVPGENLTVLVKDALKQGDNVDSILAHEIGVHANLRETAGDSFKDIENTVRERMANPDKSWNEAMKSVPGGGWEETLGHWVEQNIAKKDPLISKVKNMFNNVIGKGTKLSDIELKDVVKRSLQNEAERERGYKVLPDGSVIQGNLKFSASNVFNPNIIDHMIDVETPSGLIGNLKDLPNKISKWTENGWLYRTPYGVLVNSPSKLGRMFAEDVLEDARLRPKTGAQPISIEKQKAHIKNSLDSHLDKYYGIREKYLLESAPQEGLPIPGRMQDFNKMVREYYNSVYSTNTGGLVERDYPPAVHEAAQRIKDLWDEMVETAKSSGEKFGYNPSKNLIDKEAKFTDGEMWRRIDDQKWLTFIQKFPSLKEKGGAEEFLRDYAKATIKRPIIRERLEAIAKAKYEAKLAEWQEKVDNLAEGEKKPRRPPNRKVTDVDVEKAVENHAEDWALGVSDQNLSNLDRFKGEGHHELGLGEFVESRVPMDTSIVMETPWGEPFSYDASLRSDNLDEIIPRTINRFSGEVAIHNQFPDSKTLVNERAKFAQALEHGVEYKKIDATARDRNLEAWDDALSQIRGLRKDQDVKGVLNALGTSLRGMAYAENGSMFGANQLGELGGAIGVSGFKAVNHFIPAFANLMRDIRAGKGAGEFATLAERRVFGETAERRVWGQDYTSRVWADASTQGSLLKYMDKVQTSINFAGKVVSSLNFLPKLTDMMLRGIRQDALLDTVKWAGGENVGLLRDPFSVKKLKAAGVDAKNISKLKGDINQYITKDSEGNLLDFKMDDWTKNSPDTFWRWKTLIDNQSQRAMVQHTIGNRAIAVNQNAFTKLFFQFKDFSLKTMNSQAARMMTHRELDDALSLMFGMATNSAVYAGLAYGKAWAYFGDNEGARKEYLDRALSPQKLALAGILRGVVGSALSFGTDAYEALTGSQSFRTTVSRDPKIKKIQEPTPKDAFGDVIAQLPPVRSATDLVGSVGSAYKLVFAQKASQQDIKQLFRILPMQNSMPMIRLSEMLADKSGLPVKVRNK
jgi:hypothetical protein